MFLKLIEFNWIEPMWIVYSTDIDIVMWRTFVIIPWLLSCVDIVDDTDTVLLITWL